MPVLRYVFAFFCISVLSVICSAFCMTGSAQAEDFVFMEKPRYDNARFGFSAAWPSGRYAMREADNGDGIRLTDENGMECCLFGTHSYDVLGQSFEDTAAEWEKEFDRVTYRKINAARQWFVLSGFKNSKIRYVKCFFGDGTAYIADMQYPEAEKEKYDPFVAKIIQTFTPPKSR